MSAPVSGALLPEIQAANPSITVVGIDPSAGMLVQVQSPAPLCVMDASGLGVRSETFDVVVLAFVLASVPDVGAALAEIRRVLRPGGCVGVATWGARHRLPAAEVWDRELTTRGAHAIAPAVPHASLLDSPEKATGLFHAAGFAPITARAHPEDFVEHGEAVFTIAGKDR